MDASRDVALLKPKLEEEIEHCDVSSGYGSDVSSLDEEESLMDTSNESGVVIFTSSPNKGLSSVCESSQLVLDLDDEEQQRRDEEQQEEEVSTEEDLPWVPVPGQAECESGGSSKLPDAPVHPHPLGVPGVLSAQAPCLPGPITPELRVRPPQIWGLADEELEPWPSLFWLCSCSPSQAGPCCGLDIQLS